MFNFSLSTLPANETRILSPEVPHPQIGMALSHWKIAPSEKWMVSEVPLGSYA